MNKNETAALEAQLWLEEVLERKYSALSCLCCSASLAQSFTHISEKHRSHTRMLRAVLQEGERHAEHE